MKELFYGELGRRHLKRTHAREKVFGTLCESGPLSMSELVTLCQGSSDRASVYRAVSLFEQLGILHHLIVGGRKVIELTEGFTGHHHHLSCVRCGRLQDIHDEQLETALQQLASRHGFDAHDHVIEVNGVCRACAAGAAT